jgi:predicted enzyme related to lactoylglutathione lyase
MSNSGGRFVWYELATIDVEAAKAFYAAVMGWSTVETSAGSAGYTLFLAGNTPAAGLTKLPEEALGRDILAQWNGYIGVEDVDAAAAQARQLGGTVYIPPTDTAISRFSLIADPQMATLVLVKGRERGQEKSLPLGTPGRVSWHDLWTSDVEKAFAFYSTLFGWKKTDVLSTQAGTYQGFSIGADIVGGMCSKPADWPRSLWFYYFNVVGVEAAAKRVTSHGGQVIDGPTVLPDGARIVHCLDPQGVPFALTDTRVNVVVGCYSPRNQGRK